MSIASLVIRGHWTKFKSVCSVTSVISDDEDGLSVVDSEQRNTEVNSVRAIIPFADDFVYVTVLWDEVTGADITVDSDTFPDAEDLSSDGGPLSSLLSCLTSRRCCYVTTSLPDPWLLRVLSELMTVYREHVWRRVHSRLDASTVALCSRLREYVGEAAVEPRLIPATMAGGSDQLQLLIKLPAELPPAPPAESGDNPGPPSALLLLTLSFYGQIVRARLWLSPSLHWLMCCGEPSVSPAYGLPPPSLAVKSSVSLSHYCSASSSKCPLLTYVLLVSRAVQQQTTAASVSHARRRRLTAAFVARLGDRLLEVRHCSPHYDRLLLDYGDQVLVQVRADEWSTRRRLSVRVACARDAWSHEETLNCTPMTSSVSIAAGADDEAQMGDTGWLLTVVDEVDRRVQRRLDIQAGSTGYRV